MRSSDPFWIKPCSLACFRGKKNQSSRITENGKILSLESFSRDSLTRARITRSNPQIFIHRFSVVLHLSVSLWIAKNYARIVGVRKDGQPGIRSSLWNPEIVKHDIRRILIGVGINSLSPPLPSSPSYIRAITNHLKTWLVFPRAAPTRWHGEFLRIVEDRSRYRKLGRRLPTSILAN